MDHISKDFFGNRKSLAIGYCFICIGLLFGSWSTFVPVIKSRFSLDDAQLGILLLSMPFGALVMNPIAATLVRVKGMKLATMIGFFMLTLSFGSLFFAPSIFIIPIFLFLCGSSIAITNVSMNTCVGSLEESENVKIMSTCHGLFSFGLMFGALISSFIGGMGVLPQYYLSVFALILSGLMIFIKPTIYEIKDVNTGQSQVKTKIKMPTGTFLVMIIISLCTNITEGTMADWSAVFMREVVKTNPYYVGMALFAYSGFMGIGRLMGDNIIPRYGTNAILKYGSLLCIFGLILIIALPYTFTAIIGFATVGAGVSCSAPILYASAARAPGMQPGAGLAVMNTFAMGGFLFGPVLVGFISKASSLSISFGFVASLCIIWFFYARKVELF